MCAFVSTRTYLSKTRCLTFSTHSFIVLIPGQCRSVISIAAKIASVCLNLLCFLFCTYFILFYFIFFVILIFQKTSLWFHGCLPTFWEECVLKLFFRDPHTENTAPTKKILSKDGIILLCKNKLELIEATLFISHGPVLWLTLQENPHLLRSKKKKNCFPMN